MSKSTISAYEFFQMFPDQESARTYLEARRWPNGPVCPAVRQQRAHHRSQGQASWLLPLPRLRRGIHSA